MNLRNISGWSSNPVTPTLNTPRTGWHEANIQTDKLASITKDFVRQNFLFLLREALKERVPEFLDLLNLRVYFNQDCSLFKCDFLLF